MQLDCPPGDGVSCEVLALIAEGRSNAGIARLMGISEKSVVAHTPGI